MTCKENRNLMAAAALGDLSETERGAFERHLAACALCRTEYERMRLLTRTLGSAPTDSLSEVERLRLENAIYRRLAAAHTTRNNLFRTIVRIAAAVILIGLGYLAHPLLSRSSQPDSATSPPPPPPNYDEGKMPAYALPDPLRFENGSPVASPAEWPRRRAEILRLLQDQMYRFMPERPPILRYVTRESGPAFGGKALRKQVRIWFAVEDRGPFIDVLIYLPKTDKPAPAFLGLNFNGNHTVHADPAILLAESWVREKNLTGKPVENPGNRATDASRGSGDEDWQAEFLVSRGYALATAYCGDIDPDFDDGFKNGVHALFPESANPRPGNAWGTVCAWAWGLSRIMDYLQTDPAINARKVAVMGHSRLGKTALWAGAADERFALVISNNSGCGGAALSKRIFGEAIANMAASFPHWFCSNYYRYSNNEQALPFDQHMLLAAIAPRAAYVASAEEDRWADPKGEFLSMLNAAPVYAFLGQGGLPATAMPAVNQPVSGPRMGYHIRTGKHDILRYDWERYADFADRVFGRAPSQ